MGINIVVVIITPENQRGSSGAEGGAKASFRRFMILLNPQLRSTTLSCNAAMLEFPTKRVILAGIVDLGGNALLVDIHQNFH